MAVEQRTSICSRPKEKPVEAGIDTGQNNRAPVHRPQSVCAKTTQRYRIPRQELGHGSCQTCFGFLAHHETRNICTTKVKEDLSAETILSYSPEMRHLSERLVSNVVRREAKAINADQNIVLFCCQWYR